MLSKNIFEDMFVGWEELGMFVGTLATNKYAEVNDKVG